MSATTQSRRFAAGSLVRARGREWVVLPDSYSDHDPELVLLRPLAASDAEITGILPSLEDVQPATFKRPDPTDPGDARSARLLRDALRLGFRSSSGPFRCFAQISVEPRPYQLVPLLMALRLDPVRLLIADDVGIGKTIEASLIAKELIAQGSAARLAVLSPPHLAPQWQTELHNKFHIDAVQVLSSTARRLERGLGIGESLFERHPNVIVSTDFIKAESHRDEFVRACPELVIVDEAHGFAHGQDRGRQLRNELLTRLASDPARHIILVTATPHSGNTDAFRSLLTLLDPGFAQLPDDLSGEQGRPYRERLARHLVQRRRADIETYLDASTPFPSRKPSETTYKLTAEYRRLFEKALSYAREGHALTAGDSRAQRVHWWSALGLLRSLGSSPAAAVATLKSRGEHAQARNAEEADELGRRAVLDQAGDEDSESTDITPGARLNDPEKPDSSQETDSTQTPPSARPVRGNAWFQELARDASKLAGAGDPKLAAAVKLVDGLLAHGRSPILFCRFIPTAEYLAERLRAHLSRHGRDLVEVAAVTGTLTPEEREQRVKALAGHQQRVLVATDCLAEGINLQQSFDAVVHYDLSWNPTRHEQREGRVDRYGQPKPTVETVTLYGQNSPIDGIVLDVLLRKHEQIRKALGVAVPVPADTGTLIDAILEGLITRGKRGEEQFEQLALELGDSSREARDRLDHEWDLAAEREQRKRRSRTIYAHHTIRPDEVRRELDATVNATGSGVALHTFLTDALHAHGATVTRTTTGALDVNLSELPLTLRETLSTPPDEDRFEIPLTGSGAITRTSPVVQALAAYTLDEALDGHAVPGGAKRAGVIRTTTVTYSTVLLVARMRFHLTLTRRGTEDRRLLAEEAAVLAFTGPPENPGWIDEPELDRLLDAEPCANVSHELAVSRLSELIEQLPLLSAELERIAERRAQDLTAAHRRVRHEAGARGRVSVHAQTPLDVLGTYILLPAPTAAGRP